MGLMRMLRTLCLAALIGSTLALGGCGSTLRTQLQESAVRGNFTEASAHYEALRANDGEDEDLLALVAQALLLEVARSEDASARHDAIQQLALAGTQGTEPLRRLSAEEGPVGIEALLALARVRDREARRLLRGLADSDNPEVRAASAEAFTASDAGDAARLIAWCAEEEVTVRRAACDRLGELAPSTDALEVLIDRARSDAELRVRAAATRSLGDFGEAAALALRERLADPEARVRGAALEALLRADRASGRQAALALLSTPLNASTIDAARLLMTPLDRDTPPSAEDAALARAHLLVALQSIDPQLRGQAALALVGVTAHQDADIEPLRPLLTREPDVGVRLSLARALLSRGNTRDDARHTLEVLMSEDHGMTGLQAAVALAPSGHQDAIARLQQGCIVEEVSLRRVAARALARDAMRPNDVRLLLRDEDVSVRVQAAGGVLAARANRGG
jgi:HEAT repeat protein